MIPSVDPSLQSNQITVGLIQAAYPITHITGWQQSENSEEM